MSSKQANPNDPWGMNYFSPPKGPPASPNPNGHRHRGRPLPDQNEMFEIQRSLQRLSHEIDEAIRENPKTDLDRVKRQFDKAWKQFNNYLRENATQ